MNQPESETQVLPGGPREPAREAPAPVVREPSQPLKQVGRYELVHRLGHGGMATVHLGRSVGSAGFEKRVAIKVIHPHLSEEPDLVGMFLDEARLAAGIHHPNVVETLDLGEEQGVYYTVMELVEGDTLSALTKSLHPDHVPIPVALLILGDACDGLAAAHDLCDEHGRPRKLVHRDISPQNLLITLDGWVKISDFGIAKAAGKSHNTRPGELRGKLSYMSPEQARGEPVDHRTDIFALGIVFWELLTGERLFTGKSDAVILDKVVRCDIPPVSDLRGDSLASVPAEVFEGIKRVLERTLAADPDDRYGSVKELGAEIRGLRRQCAADVEPRGWLADLMADRFGSRVDYLRAMLRESSGQTPVPAANGVRRGRRRTNRTGLDDVAAAARAAAAADPGDNTTQFGLDARAPTGSAPALSTTASHTMPLSTVGRMRQLGTWLLLPMIGAGIAIAVMSRQVGESPPPDEVTPASVQPGATKGVAGPGSDRAVDEVKWFFSTDPDGATVTVDGERLAGTTPTNVTLKRSDTPLRVVIEKPGFVAATAKLAPVADQSHSYRLDPVPAADDAREAPVAGDAKDPKRLILRRPKSKGAKGGDDGQGEELMPMPDFDKSSGP